MNLARLNVVLLLLGVVLAVALSLLLTEDGDALPGRTAAERHVDVTRAATTQVQAFLGIDHEKVDAQTAAVLEGATGDFKEQYAAELDTLKRSARDQRSTAVADVLEVGISDIDADSASVFVAANTEVTSRATRGEPKTVPWRIELTMVEQDGRWLTAGLRFVG